MNEKYLNKLYSAAISFGKNWRKPIEDLLKDDPSVSQNERVMLCNMVEKARTEIERYVENHFEHEKGLTIPENEATSWIKLTYPWMNKKNIFLSISREIYYAWHG